MQIDEQLRQRIEDIVSKSGCVLFDSKLIGTHPVATLKLLIDTASGRITLGECAKVNSKLRALFQDQDASKEQYMLEVSSPGADWPLKHKRDFRRIIGQKVHLYLGNILNGKSELEGVLTEVRENSLILQVNQELLEINLCDISKAKEKY